LDGVLVVGSSPGEGEWVGVTHCRIVLAEAGSSASGAAYAAAVQMSSTDAPTLRGAALLNLMVAGRETAVLAILFTDGAPAQALAAPTIIWRPGVPSFGNSVETFAEVAALVTATRGFATLVVDDAHGLAVVPSTADLECFDRLVIEAWDIASNARVTFADGGRLRNLGEVDRLVVVGSPTLRSPLLFDSGNGVFDVVDSAIASLPGATVAMIEIAATTILYQTGQSAIDNTLVPAVPMVQIDPGVFFGWTLVGGNFPAFSGTAVRGDGTTSFAFQHDASVVFVPQSLMLGSVSESRVSFAEALQPSSGITAARPVITVAAFTGQMYFDTTLGIPIWWNGAAWVNSAGLVV
jgi:hypothetical protein